jgi:hypothetical protein
MRRWNTVAESALSPYSGSAISSVSGLSSEVNPNGHSMASQ